MQQPSLPDCLRRALGEQTQRAFGERYGVSQQTVSRWVRGEAVPRLQLLRRIANDHRDLFPLFLLAILPKSGARERA